MKRLILLALLAPAMLFGAANDLLLTQVKSSGSGNIGRNVAPTAFGFMTFDTSKVPISPADITWNSGTDTLGVPDGTSITSLGSLAITAGGTDENVAITPSGTGSHLIGSATNFGGAQGLVHLATNEDKNAIMVDVASSTGNYPYVAGRKAQGTLASPAAIAANTNTFQLNGFGYDGTAFIKNSDILFRVPSGSTVATNRVAGEIVFTTHPDSTSAAAVAMTIAANQVVTLSSTAASTSTTTGALVVNGGIGMAGTQLSVPDDFTLSSAGSIAITAGGTNENVTITPSGTGIVGVLGTKTATSGNEYGLSITPTYNQASGTAANTDLLVNRTETAVGSGTQRLADLQVGSVTQWHVTNTGNVVQTGSLTTSQTAGIIGTTTNNNANAGSIGEYIEATVSAGSSVSLTDNTTANITSISLTAGDWDVTGVVNIIFTGANVTDLFLGTNTISGSIGGENTYVQKPVGYTGATSTYADSVPVVRYSLSATATVYLVVKVNFGAGTSSAYGLIRARRMR